MGTILLVIHLLVAILLVSVILMKRSEGGALDGLGGGSGASNFLSALGTGNFLTRATAILATLFFITSLSLSLYYKGHTANGAKSLLDVAPAEQQVPAEPSVPVAPTAEK